MSANMFALLLLSVVSVSGQSPIVQTPLGSIQGFEYATTAGPTAEVFLNIPFAQPPVGPLRFEKPLPSQPWTGVRNGTSFGFDCIPHVKAAIIPGRSVSEDCLTLNVIKPKQPSVSGPLPVLVWVHGGGYEIGSASLFGYKGFAEAYIPEDIIVVTFQYRLGVLGFFSTGNRDVPGNLGLWDMALAFKFINENIASFGGDPSKVTAWGLSAGGSAAGQLALSPHSRDYISGTIEMSGSPLASWAYGRKVPYHSRQLSNNLGCNRRRTVKECMKEKTIDEIYAGVLNIGYTTNDLENVKWGPVVDGDFMPDYADRIIRSGQVASKPSLIGVSNKDAAYFMLMGYSPFIQNASVGSENLDGFYKEQLRSRLRNFVRGEDYKNKYADALAHVDEFYVDQGTENSTNGYYLNQYDEFGTDVFFKQPASQEIKAKRKMGWPVYAYSFDHYNEAIWSGKNVPEEARGSVHTNEYSYMFNLYIMGYFPITGEEVLVRDTMQKTIISFTKTGVPKYSNNDVLSSVGSSSCLQYLSISPNPQMKVGFYSEGVDFWNEMCRLGFDLTTMRRTNRQNCDIDQQRKWRF